MPPIHTKDNVRAAHAPLTKKNLAKLEGQQAKFWADTAKATKMRQEQSQKVREAAEGFGVDLSILPFKNLGKCVDGMSPMERFVDGRNNS